MARDGDCLPGASRISVVLTLPHRPGSLAEVLSEISARGINLIRIESTPIPGKDFEFRFYIDFEENEEHVPRIPPSGKLHGRDIKLREKRRPLKGRLSLVKTIGNDACIISFC